MQGLGGRVGSLRGTNQGLDLLRPLALYRGHLHGSRPIPARPHAVLRRGRPGLRVSRLHIAVRPHPCLPGFHLLQAPRLPLVCQLKGRLDAAVKLPQDLHPLREIPYVRIHGAPQGVQELVPPRATDLVELPAQLEAL